jgi:hypothetical protein
MVIPTPLTAPHHFFSDYLSLPLLFHARGKPAIVCNPYGFVVVNLMWKAVDKQVIVTLPKSGVVVLSTNSQP